MFELEFDPPDVSPRLAVITIDRPDESVNSIAPEFLDQVEGLIDAVEGEPDVAAVILISGKPDSFIVGADVETFAKAKDRRDIEAFSRRGHAVLGRLSRSRKPVVVAIHGAALGAGFELALACHYRICTDSPKTVLGLPEIKLGLFPGGGGISRLPRMVGIQKALDLVLTGRTLRARQAAKMGLVDRVVGPEALRAAARDAAAKLAAGELRSEGQTGFDPVRALTDSNPLGRKIIFRQARKMIQRRTHGLYPAPLVAIDVMEQGLKVSLERAMALEPPAFAELAVGDVSRSLVSLFLRSNALKKQTVEAAGGKPAQSSEIDRLGLLGGGFMGADIAIVAADNGIETRIREIASEPLAGALGHVRQFFDRRARKVGSRHVFKARNRVSGSLDLEGFETFDLIIEAVPEELALKQRVFAELESLVGDKTILATNTSALPLVEIGENLKNRSRFVGLHFFSPVPKMPLLEIIRHPDTSPETLATCIAFSRRIGKTPVVVRDGPGFYTTRVLGFYLMAALDMLQRGHSISDIDRGAQKVGWPVGPLALLDEVGVDVGAKVAKTMAKYFPQRVQTVEGVESFLAEKRLGRKSGRGFYVYPKKGRKEPDESVYAFFGQRPTPPRTSPDELGERLTLVAALEAVRCLEEGVISKPRDGDVAAVFGFGYPPMRGGPFRHLDRRGLSTVVARAGTFEQRFGSMYEVPKLLQRLASEGKDFSTWETPT